MQKTRRLFACTTGPVATNKDKEKFSALDNFQKGPGAPPDRSGFRKSLKLETARLLKASDKNTKPNVRRRSSKHCKTARLKYNLPISFVSRSSTIESKSARTFHNVDIQDLRQPEYVRPKSILHRIEHEVNNAMEHASSGQWLERRKTNEDLIVKRKSKSSLDKPLRAPRPMPVRRGLGSESSTPRVSTHLPKTFLTETVDDTGEYSQPILHELDDDGGVLQETDEKRQGGSVDIMSLLDHRRLGDLAAEFEKYPDAALTLEEFVDVITPFLPSEHLDDAEIVSSLCKLFDDVDVNGDGTMEWEEFTGYVVDAGLHTSSASNSADRIDDFERVDISMSCLNGPNNFAVTKLEYLDKLDQVLVWERGCSNIRVLDSMTMIQKTSITGHRDEVFSAIYMHECDWLVTCANDRRLCVWDPYKSYARIRDIDCQHAQVALCWHGDDNRLFSVDDAQMIHVWNLEDVNYESEPVHTFQSHHQHVLDMKILKNLNLLATASLDSTIGLFDVATHRRSHTLRGHTRGVIGLAYHTGYHCIVSGGYDHKALIWDPNVSKSICALNGHYNPLVGVSILENSPQIATADSSGVVKIWDIRNYACVQTFNVSDKDDVNISSIMAMSTCPARKRLLFAGVRGVYVYDGLSAAAKSPLLADLESTVVALYNDHFGTLVTASGCVVKCWSADTGVVQEIYRNCSNDVITALAFDDSQKKIIIGDASGSVRVLNGLNGSIMKESDVGHGSSVSSVFYVGDLKAVASSGWNHFTHLYDDNETESDKIFLLRQARQQSDEISCAVLNEELCLMASGGANGTIALWDYDANTAEATLHGHKSEITAMLFLGNLPLLMSADTDGNLCMWIVRPIVCGDGAGHCIMRVKNNRDAKSSEACAILALAFVEDTGTLYSGDSSGCIKAWSISTALWRLNVKPYVKPPARIPGGDANDRDPSTPPTLDAAPQPTTEPMVRELRPLQERMHSYEMYRQENRRMMQQIFNPNLESIFKSGDVKLLKVWSAHLDSIRSISLVVSAYTEERIAGLISSSYDNAVHVWDLRGNLLGSLNQGRSDLNTNGDRVPFRPWKLKFDVDKRRRRAHDQAIAVLKHNRTEHSQQADGSPSSSSSSRRSTSSH